MVQPKQQYRIRVKGYRTGSNPVYISVKVNGSTDVSWPGAALPASDKAESWIEQIITVPAGATTMDVGATWNTSINTEVFYLNEMEITLLGSTKEYQYHIKDHLGNVRLTFTSKTDAQVDLATLETANLGSERAKFLRYDNAKRVNSILFDRTNGAATGHAQRLNGSANEKYGMAKSLAVLPGDVINMEVYAKYVDTNTANWTAALNTLMGQIAANAAGVVVDGATYASSTSSFPFAGLLNTTGSTGGPKAYLNWLVFNKNFAYLNGGYMRLSATPKETGQDVAHERLHGTINVTEPGYVYIYLSNEETAPVEVFFDDFKVTHTKTPVVSSQDYYPYGLTFNSYQRENNLLNAYKYNGKEEQDELAMNWTDYGARMYSADIGRWTAIDPLAELSKRWSPYNYAYDNPLKFIDPDGMYPSRVQKDIGTSGEEVDNDEVGGGNDTSNRDLSGYNSSGGSSKDIKQLMGQGDKKNATAKAREKMTATIAEGLSKKSDKSSDSKQTQTGPYSGIDISFDGLRQYLAIVAGESGNNIDEASAIGSVILNRLAHKGANMQGDFVSQIGGEGQYDAIGGRIYNEVMAFTNSDLEHILNNPSSLHGKYADRIMGAMGPIMNNKDYSQGAYFWNASSPQTGFNWNQYNNGTFVITTSYGSSTFFRYADGKGKIWP